MLKSDEFLRQMTEQIKNTKGKSELTRGMGQLPNKPMVDLALTKHNSMLDDMRYSVLTRHNSMLDIMRESVLTKNNTMLDVVRDLALTKHNTVLDIMRDSALTTHNTVLDVMRDLTLTKQNTMLDVMRDSVLAKRNSMLDVMRDVRGIGFMADNIKRAMEPFSSTFAKIAIDYQEEWEKMYSIIPTAAFADIDVTKIESQYFDVLITDIGKAQETINWENFKLTYSDFQELSVVIARATENISVKGETFINNLLEYAEKASPKIKILVSDLIYRLIVGYLITAFIITHPIESVNGLSSNTAKIEVLQEVSQQVRKTILPEQLNQHRLVIVRELNVRSEPSLDSVIIGGLYFGMDVQIIQINVDWALVQWNEMDGIIIKGWVNKRYLTKLKESQTEKL